MQSRALPGGTYAAIAQGSVGSSRSRGRLVSVRDVLYSCTSRANSESSEAPTIGP